MEPDPKSWLVIGGTHGTGLHFVNSLLADGEHVEVVGRREEPKFHQTSGSLCYHRCDLNQGEEVTSLINKLTKKSAPFSKIVLLQRYRNEQPDWRAEIETCLTSTHLILDAAPQLMGDTTDGAVVLVGSVAQQLVFPSQPASYHITKAGLRQLARYYAVTLGPKNIRVNIVVPATILKDEAREYYQNHPEELKSKAAASPLDRVGTPEDIGNAIRFLCSEKASFVTGQELVVDGGISLLAHEYTAGHAKP